MLERINYLVRFIDSITAINNMIKSKLKGVLTMNNNELWTTCDHCGTAIKHVYEWNGHKYGSECFEKITGCKLELVVFKNNKVDQEATTKKAKQTAEDITKQMEYTKQFNQEQQIKKQTLTEKNQWLIDVLKSKSNPNGWDFYNSISDDLTKMEISELSYKVQIIISEIYAKANGDKKGSKSYKTRIAEFESKSI
jgi:hypothetical protein